MDYIMRTIEELEFLNGLKVERDILDDEDEEDEDVNGQEHHNGIDSVEEEEEYNDESESVSQTP